MGPAEFTAREQDSEEPAAASGCRRALGGGAVLIWAGRQRKMQLCVSAFSELHTFKEAVLFQVEGMCR